MSLDYTNQIQQLIQRTFLCPLMPLLRSVQDRVVQTGSVLPHVIQSKGLILFSFKFHYLSFDEAGQLEFVYFIFFLPPLWDCLIKDIASPYKHWINYMDFSILLLRDYWSVVLYFSLMPEYQTLISAVFWLYSTCTQLPKGWNNVQYPVQVTHIPMLPESKK